MPHPDEIYIGVPAYITARIVNAADGQPQSEAVFVSHDTIVDLPKSPCGAYGCHNPDCEVCFENWYDTQFEIIWAAAYPMGPEEAYEHEADAEYRLGLSQPMAFGDDYPDTGMSQPDLDQIPI